jgi:hypothetical protein
MDLQMTEGGDLYTGAGDVALTTGVAATTQRLRVKLRMFKGEWFLNTREGVPYFDRVFIKTPSLATVTAIFRGVILADPGVTELVSFTAQLETTTRDLLISFHATCVDGNPIVFTDFVVSA